MQLKQLALTTALLAITGAQDSGSSSSSDAGAPTLMFNASDLETLNTTGRPHFVSLTERTAWCTSQRTACTTLCGGDFSSNACDANALTWDCTCGQNNSAPGLGYYASTMPNNICTRLNGICTADNAMNGVEAQQQCNRTFVCGDLNITAFSSGNSDNGGSGDGASPTASGTGASASETPSSTGSGSGTATSQAAAAALHVSEHYGAAVLSGALVAALGLLL